MDKGRKEGTPLLMFTVSMLIFGTIGLVRRNTPLPSALIACTRGILGGLVLLVFMIIRRPRAKTKMTAATVLGLCVSGAVMGFNWILLFEAYNHTTIATATLCYYMQPTIVVLLSPVFFHEKLTRRKMLFSLIAVAGMVLVSGVTEGDNRPGSITGIALGLGAAALYAAVVIMNKKITGVDVLRKTVIQLFSAGAVMIPYLLATDGLKSADFSFRTAALLLTAGVVHTGIAYILYFGSLPRLPAQTAAIFSYVDPVSAMAFSALLLGERMSIHGIIGAMMIIGSAIGCTLSERRKGEDHSPCQSDRNPL